MTSFPLEQAGPAQFDWLIHFTGRPAGTATTPCAPSEITRLQPEQRLFYNRQAIYDVDGGPVWYVRQEHHDALRRDQLPWANRLNTTPDNRSDWLHEREWRVPVPPTAPALSLLPGAVMAILIGTPGWQPSQRIITKDTGYFIDQSTGQYTDPANIYARPETREELSLPPLWESAPRMYWDPNTQQFTLS